MAQSLFRVGGGYTSFVFNGRPLLYLDIIEDQAPQPVAQPEDIHPLGAEHPIEIAFPVAHGSGQLRLTVKEQWNANAWEQLPGFEGTKNIVDVFRRNMALGSITCQKIITTPSGRRRVVTYHGCAIVAISDSESVNVGTVTLPKQITVRYTHRTST